MCRDNETIRKVNVDSKEEKIIFCVRWLTFLKAQCFSLSSFVLVYPFFLLCTFLFSDIPVEIVVIEISVPDHECSGFFFPFLGHSRIS